MHCLNHCRQGVSLTYMRDIPNFCTYFLVYEVLRTKVRQLCYLLSAHRRLPLPSLSLSVQLMKRNPSESHVAHVFSTLVAGGLAGLSGWAVAIPMDVVKNRHQGRNRAFFETFYEAVPLSMLNSPPHARSEFLLEKSPIPGYDPPVLIYSDRGVAL